LSDLASYIHVKLNLNPETIVEIYVKCKLFFDIAKLE